MVLTQINWEGLLAQYGYLAVLVGTFLEGESILLAAGYVAHAGSLSLVWVVACAFCGSCLGDQLFFVLGRRYGRQVLARWPRWQARVDRASQLLGRWQLLFMLSFRFLYGLRTVSPFCLGMSPVAWRRFVACNVIGAAVWATALGAAGWGMGELFGHAPVGQRGREMAALAALVVALLLAAVWAHRRLRRPPTAPPPRA